MKLINLKQINKQYVWSSLFPNISNSYKLAKKNHYSEMFLKSKHEKPHAHFVLRFYSRNRALGTRTLNRTDFAISSLPFYLQGLSNPRCLTLPSFAASCILGSSLTTFLRLLCTHFCCAYSHIVSFYP